LSCNGGRLSDAGIGLRRTDDNLITLINPTAGTYHLAVLAESVNGEYSDATADLIVRQKSRLPLNFAAALNSNGASHTDTRQLIDTERAF
jgi:hypothetical protein